MDLRQRVGDGGDLRGLGVDVDRDPDRDHAEVVGAGDGRDRGHEAQRRALVGAGQVDLAGDVDGMGAGAGAGDRGADLAGGRAGRRGLLGGARVAGGAQARDRRLRAVGDALELARNPGRCRHLRAGEVLVAVVAAELQRERAVRARRVVFDARFEARREGPRAVRAGAAARGPSRS